MSALLAAQLTDGDDRNRREKREIGNPDESDCELHLDLLSRSLYSCARKMLHPLFPGRQPRAA